MVIPPMTSPVTLSRLALSRMTFADLPPSSSTTFFSVSAPWPYTLRPTAPEPVKLTRSTPGCRVRASPAGMSPVTMFSTPAGSPASCATSPMSSASSGVNGDGLSTVVQPAASAGAIPELITPASSSPI
jgi:hypothetical protein